MKGKATPRIVLNKNKHMIYTITACVSIKIICNADHLKFMYYHLAVQKPGMSISLSASKTCRTLP